MPRSCGIAAGFFIAAVHLMGLVALTHMPNPMAFVGELLGRPANDKAMLIMPVGYPASGARVPDLAHKSVDRVGISPEHLGRMFEPFSQADQARTRRADGTGIGLAVARRTAPLLGGDIGATSALGRGSVFTITLQRDKTSAALLEPATIGGTSEAVKS